jgi:magnesium chelatase family protein
LSDHLNGNRVIAPQEPVEIDETHVWVQTDFQEIKGQEHIKRALEVAAGGHKVIMIGPPGAEKHCLPGRYRRFCLK